MRLREERKRRRTRETEGEGERKERGGEGRRGIKNLLTTCNLTWPKGKRGNKRANSSGAGYQKQASVGWTDTVVNVFPVLL